MLTELHTLAQAAAPAEPLAFLEEAARETVERVLRENVGYILVVFTFYLAIAVGGALLSWYRNRNEPKQLNLF